MTNPYYGRFCFYPIAVDDNNPTEPQLIRCGIRYHNHNRKKYKRINLCTKHLLNLIRKGKPVEEYKT